MTAKPTNTRKTLSQFDGKNTTLLTELLAQKTNRGVLEELLSDMSVLAGDDNQLIGDGATWILYHHLKNGGTLSTGQQSALIENANKTTSWPAQLHICQLVQFIDVTIEQAKTLVQFLAPLLTHERPFLRAWSLDALCQLALRHSEYLPTAKAAHAAAKEDKAASVRARARNISI